MMKKAIRLLLCSLIILPLIGCSTVPQGHPHTARVYKSMPAHPTAAIRSNPSSPQPDAEYHDWSVISDPVLLKGNEQSSESASLSPWDQPVVLQNDFDQYASQLGPWEGTDLIAEYPYGDPYYTTFDPNPVSVTTYNYYDPVTYDFIYSDPGFYGFGMYSYGYPYRYGMPWYSWPYSQVAIYDSYSGHRVYYSGFWGYNSMWSPLDYYNPFWGYNWGSYWGRYRVVPPVHPFGAYPSYAYDPWWGWYDEWPHSVWIHNPPRTDDDDSDRKKRPMLSERNDEIRLTSPGKITHITGPDLDAALSRQTEASRTSASSHPTSIRETRPSSYGSSRTPSIPAGYSYQPERGYTVAGSQGDRTNTTTDSSRLGQKNNTSFQENNSPLLKTESSRNPDSTFWNYKPVTPSPSVNSNPRSRTSDSNNSSKQGKVIVVQPSERRSAGQIKIIPPSSSFDHSASRVNSPIRSFSPNMESPRTDFSQPVSSGNVLDAPQRSSLSTRQESRSLNSPSRSSVTAERQASYFTRPTQSGPSISPSRSSSFEVSGRTASPSRSYIQVTPSQPRDSGSINTSPMRSNVPSSPVAQPRGNSARR